MRHDWRQQIDPLDSESCKLHQSEPKGSFSFGVRAEDGLLKDRDNLVRWILTGDIRTVGRLVKDREAHIHSLVRARQKLGELSHKILCD